MNSKKMCPDVRIYIANRRNDFITKILSNELLGLTISTCYKPFRSFDWSRVR